MTLDPGTCAFCGMGGGYLGGTGDETTQHLHSSVRTGEPGNWKYKTLEGAKVASYVTWCGMCHRGLAHKYQRYDDHNLRALQVSYEVRLKLDGIRWEFWGATKEERAAMIEGGYVPDDIAVHNEKLHVETDLRDIQEEIFRRYGHKPRKPWTE